MQYLLRSEGYDLFHSIHPFHSDCLKLVEAHHTTVSFSNTFLSVFYRRWPYFHPTNIVAGQGRKIILSISIYKVFCSPLSGHYVTVQCLDDWAFEVLKDVMWTLLLLSGCPCCSNLRSLRMNKTVYVSVVLCLCQHHLRFLSARDMTWLTIRQKHVRAQNQTNSKLKMNKTYVYVSVVLCLCQHHVSALLIRHWPVVL